MTIIDLRKKHWIPLAGIVVLAVFVIFLLQDTGLKAQSPLAFTPNMVGTWAIQSGGACSFDNVLIPEPPTCGEFAAEEQLMISKQQGRAFAGLIPGDPGSKITGVIDEDGSFIMQGVNGTNHLFYSGKVSFKRNTLEMRGLGNEFEDWSKALYPSMSSLWFTARKIN